MAQLRVFRAIAVGLASLSLLITLVIYREWFALPLPLLAGGLWLVAIRLDWRWVHGPAAFLLILGAAWHVWLGVASFWMLLILVLILIGWDLDRLDRDLAVSKHLVNETQLVRIHLRRLVIVVILGVVLGSLGLALNYTLNIGLALILGLSLILLLNRAMRLMRG